jgi:hypothetical protein
MMKIAAWLQGLLKAGLVCVSGSLASVPAYGFVQEITAEFRPDPANPLYNKFKNTTPGNGFCEAFIPQRCEQLGIFSIRTFDVQFNNIETIQGNHTDPRKGAMFKVPNEWRELTVSNVETGQSESLKVRIGGMGGKFNMAGADMTAWEGGNAGRWVYVRAPCIGTGIAYGNARQLLWSWLSPANTGACSVQAVKDVPTLFYETFEFFYELQTPNPLKMAAGRYVGSISYSIGPGADFDYGDIMQPTDNVLVMNFTLDVDHHLRVEVPPGANRIQLEPQGGWQAWLNNGRKPSRLFRDQTVNLWASSQFKMNLECGEPLGNTCGLRNAAGHQVPVDVAVTLPPGLTDAAGRPVNRLPLRLDGSGTERFQPSRYIDRKPSTLHFEVKADAVAQMLDQGGSTYNGTVTVVWDSEV